MRRLGGRQLSASLFLAAAFLFFIALWNADFDTVVLIPLQKKGDDCDSEATEDSLDDKVIKSGDSIFFHETSCRRRPEDRRLSPRQACAVESAARGNPEKKVYLLFSSIQNHSADALASVLLSYDNVHFERIILQKYAAGTPLEKWLQTGQLEQSTYRTSHTSDVLRFLTLWKYGGIYMDLDVVVARPLKDLGLNWAGFESPNHAGSSVLGFSKDELGRRFTDAALRELSTNFKGHAWSHNGPHLIDRVMKSLCSDNKLPGTIGEERCQGFRMFPPEYFYPIPYESWKKYFTQEAMEEFKTFENITYVYHVWNKLSSEFQINSSTQVPYTYLAEKYCPKVYALTKERFYAEKH